MHHGCQDPGPVARKFTGDGGAVVTTDADLAERFADHYVEVVLRGITTPGAIVREGTAIFPHGDDMLLPGDRAILFTQDNATAFDISRRFLIPSITHQTPTEERRWILSAFNEGRLPAVVTSRVLNEGVDMPAARVGIVLSGSGSVREHVQRLGRLLRRHGDKEAMLYEVVTSGTSEEHTSDRRREHRAYDAPEDAHADG